MRVPPRASAALRAGRPRSVSARPLDSRFRENNGVEIGNGGVEKSGMNQRQRILFLAKVGAPRGRGVSESGPQPEIKYELKPTDPLSLYGRGLG